MLKSNIKKISVFAPASSSNLSVGFDILGFPFAALGDEVTLTFNQSKKITIEHIDCNNSLPLAPDKNTATHALMAMCDYLNLNIGIAVKIKKGIPLCSGLGGSAASAVAAIFALNQCLVTPLELNILATFAINAEGIVSGEVHADNVVPSLWGELTLVRQLAPLDVIVLPMPQLYCILIHPNTEISTKSAREALQSKILLKDHIKQSANLAAFISSFYTRNWQQLKNSCHDVLIEPQRAHLLKGFYEVKQSALDSGALCCSYSGAGPTMFALSETLDGAKLIADTMQNKFNSHGLESQAWYELMDINGPKVIGINDEIS